MSGLPRWRCWIGILLQMAVAEPLLQPAAQDVEAGERLNDGVLAEASERLRQLKKSPGELAVRDQACPAAAAAAAAAFTPPPPHGPSPAAAGTDADAQPEAAALAARLLLAAERAD